MALGIQEARVQPHAETGRCIPGYPPRGPRTGRKEVVMVIALWIVAVAACFALCGWGIATAVRRSKERRAQAVKH
jgi:hypothetical protein